uniref:Uncharacterized protein n=1 Tax=Arundo donax TaxID=35708 RepID=A0A0A8Y8A2_ARUDO
MLAQVIPHCSSFHEIEILQNIKFMYYSELMYPNVNILA